MSTATTNSLSILAQSYGIYGGRGSMASWNLANLYTRQSGSRISRSQSQRAATQAENQRRSTPESFAEYSSSSTYRALCTSLEVAASQHPIVQDAVSAFSKIVGLLSTEMGKSDKMMMDGIMIQMRSMMAGLLLVLERTPIPPTDFFSRRSDIQGLMADVTSAIERAYDACTEYEGYDNLKRIVTAPYWTDVFDALEEDLKRYESRINTELGALHREGKDVVCHRHQEEGEGELEKAV